VLANDARILRALRNAGVHLLPSDIALLCELSMVEVEHAITGLQSAGFDIESRPGLGWRLISSPDRIIADDLHSRLGDCLVAREILVFAETNSTNDVAANLGRQGHAGGVAVFAERQTAGRGRFGRRWVSADHEGLWFSLLLRPELPVSVWPRLTTWAGVCVAKVVGEMARIKWPNDVLVGGRKVAGILIESVVDHSGNPFAIVGIGLNLNQTEFPPELENRATSLRLAFGAPIERAAFAASLLAELGRTLPYLSARFPEILAEAARRSAVLGEWVKLHSGTEVFEGLAESLDGDGNLIIRGIDGTEMRMSNGEISSKEIIS
jgi:BirA family transcriptional regulator, biotin operon repressor / biotin---[acetyl-CoA-carboxylase] ligase